MTFETVSRPGNRKFPIGTGSGCDWSVGYGTGVLESSAFTANTFNPNRRVKPRGAKRTNRRYSQNSPMLTGGSANGSSIVNV